MNSEDTGKTLALLATMYGRMILISEIADLAPIERTQIPTDPPAYAGMFWSYTPAQQRQYPIGQTLAPQVTPRGFCFQGGRPAPQS